MANLNSTVYEEGVWNEYLFILDYNILYESASTKIIKVNFYERK